MINKVSSSSNGYFFKANKLYNSMKEIINNKETNGKVGPADKPEIQKTDEPDKDKDDDTVARQNETQAVSEQNTRFIPSSPMPGAIIDIRA